MAIYRKVETKFWQDRFIRKLNTDEKLFYLYLLTNDKTTQCGIYELPIDTMSFETGFSREKIEELLKAFIEKDKIIYDKTNEEIFLYCWPKYHSLVSPKIKKCVENELRAVKTKAFLNELDTVLIQYGYCIDTQSLLLNTNTKYEYEQKTDEIPDDIESDDEKARKKYAPSS